MKLRFCLYIFLVGSLMKTVTAESNNNETCQLDFRNLSAEEFEKAACARCYQLLPNIFKKPGVNLKFVNDTIMNSDEEELSTDPQNISPVIIDSIIQPFAFKLTSCCLDASKCYRMMRNGTSQTGSGLYCSRTWDGRQCWDDTPAGHTARQKCSLSSYLYHASQPPCPRYVEKKCLPSGQWELNNCLDWSNYASCGFQEIKVVPPVRPNGTCRIDTGEYLTPEQFRQATCARCYIFLHKEVIIKGKQLLYEGDTFRLCDPNNGTSYAADPENIPSAIRDSVVSEEAIDKWVSCCQSSQPCCDKMLADADPQWEGPYCRRTWDGWQCWPDTPANETATAQCSRNAYTFSRPSCIRYAKKECRRDGTWFRKKGGNEWTNYKSCGDPDTSRLKLDIHIATLSVSMFFLLPAIICFVHYRKQLQSYRMRMHRNLFISLFLNAFMFILLEGYVVYDELKTGGSNDIVHMNKAGCKIIVVLNRYFRTCNYMWMLCEGFYLHKQIVAAFSQQRSFLLFYVVGWVFPAVLVAIYSIIRKVMFDETCWIGVAGNYEWIYSLPLLLSLLINVGFLIDIIRVLVSKLRASSTSHDDQIRRAVRAIFFLVPLFGIHFLLLSYRPINKSCLSLDIYTSFANFIDGIQGTLVALLFCYLNREVWGVLQKSYYRYRLKRAPPLTSVSRPSCDNVETTDLSGLNSNGKSSQ